MISSTLHLEKENQVKLFFVRDKIALSITNNHFDDFTIIANKKILMKVLLESLSKISEDSDEKL